MENAYQINDGLHETASCGNAAAYDRKRGLIFAEYMTGEQCMYGESRARSCSAYSRRHSPGISNGS